MPASAITSASPIFWQVMPSAPAATCILAMVGLWVLMCGRLATPAASQALDARDVALDLVHVDDGAGRAVFAGDLCGERDVVIEGSSSRLFDLFAQHFELQPFVFGFRQFLLRLRQRVRGLVEFLAILVEEIGVVKKALLLGDLGLQLGDGLRQRFQRVLLVEIQPALRAPEGAPTAASFFSRGGAFAASRFRSAPRCASMSV